ncbi:type II toxin-antitoxin system RelE/ParE family toxin [Candidatus Albibeggiatoa sp. nov. BB20]|uniref:type II toxin-antitoxin system RelE family toxin n=1 Tax=Candidatus Albibeggiatoa sp. nov. BB20 TaxID=3162723 RepID=UPI003365429A
MEVKYESRFLKDLQNINNQNTLDKIKTIIETCKQAESIQQINHLKKMRGYNQFYRIRAGDYRLGVSLHENRLIFVRCLHRKDIYRYFP